MSCFNGPKLVFISCPLWCCCWLLKHLLAFVASSFWTFLLHFKLSVPAGVSPPWQSNAVHASLSLYVPLQIFIVDLTVRFFWRVPAFLCVVLFFFLFFFSLHHRVLPFCSLMCCPLCLMYTLKSGVASWGGKKKRKEKKKTKLLQIQCEITAKPIFSTMPFER